MTLTGVNTYSGTTNLNDGTLIVTGSLAGGITMSAPRPSTTLSGTGTINGPVTDASSTIIAPGATAANGAVGTLTFASNLTFFGGGQINMDLSNNTASGNDLINVGGTPVPERHHYRAAQCDQRLPVDGYLSPDPQHRLTLRQRRLEFDALGIQPTRGRPLPSSDISPNYIDLVVSGDLPANLVWKGDSSANVWDVVNPANQIWSKGGTPDTFYNYDHVTFDDTGSITPAVNINAIVMPASITVDSSQDYTFSGTGRISGSGTLTKSGSGTLTVSTSQRLHGRDHHHRRHAKGRHCTAHWAARLAEPPSTAARWISMA